MLGAYEGLMKAGPQAMQGPAQNMGGQAQLATWKDEADTSDQQILGILDEIDRYHARHITKGDLTPAEISHVHSLHQRLNAADSARQHALEQDKMQVTGQGNLAAILEDSKRLRRRAEDATTGKVAPPPVRR